MLYSKIKLNWEVLCCSVDASSELKARGVQSGDKVLEVNNIIVTDATVEKVMYFNIYPHWTTASSFGLRNMLE